jgi:pyridoxamine 5'-phosphate oxidase
MSLRDRRVQYETAGLDRADLLPDPIEQWHRWYAQAAEGGVSEPNAMTLATTGLDGTPDARVVLVRGADAHGLAFYSNFDSAKGRQLEAHPAAAVVFAWLDLHRQVRARGKVVCLDDAESDAYFASRPRETRLGAWASPQSTPLADRTELEELFERAAERFEGADVPRPPQWGGWRLVPDRWEFWQGRPHRLHDRFVYELVDEEWRITRLAP